MALVEPWKLEVCKVNRYQRIERVRLVDFRCEHDMDAYIKAYVPTGGVAQISRWYSTHVCRIVLY